MVELVLEVTPLFDGFEQTPEAVAIQ